MARGIALLLTVLLLASIPGLGQIGVPGGGYPGRRYPQGTPGSQAPASRPNQAATTFTGMLRSIGKNNLVIESDDKTITTISTAKSIKYIGVSGSSASIGDFQPGDHVRISANQDNHNVYHASTMTMIREGTTEEHAAASQATNDTSRPLSSDSTGGSSSKSAAGSASGSDNGGPALRRAASNPDSGSGSSSSSSSSGSSISNDDPDRPRLHRTTGSSDSTPSTQINPGDSATTSATVSRPPAPTAPQDADDSGPPQLRRGGSASPSMPSTNSDAADARPSLKADTANGATRMPPPPQSDAPSYGPSSTGDRTPQRAPESGDSFIDQTREAAFSFSETLPNYVVKQYTTRYASRVARGGQTSWQTQDNVTADVIEENGTEKYKNILVNGQPPRVDVEKTGSWSRGEFSSIQADVLSRATNANFHGKQSTTIVNRAAFVYSFSVAQPNSHWHVGSDGQSYLPAYSGSVWIDKENYRVLRIELSAKNLPSTFPLDIVESAVDYDYVLIGEGKYLLPVHSEALSCLRGTSDCSRNVIEFRNYKKFTADSNITFSPDK
jgi:hypothetical protein